MSIVILAAMNATACHRSVPLPAPPPGALLDSAAAVERGAYIVRVVSNCSGCHGSEKDPAGPLSGGMEFKGWRLGTVRASNITPDSATGIGAWSDAEVVRALRTGIRRGGRLLAPVMPYEWLHAMSDADAFAVAQYLKAQPAVRHEVRQNPNLIFRIARATILSPRRGQSTAAPPRGATPAYGEYLAQHVGFCGECHTPRGGLTDASNRRKLFAGQAHPPSDFPAKPSNITPDSATGIGRWSEQDFARAMREGVDPDGRKLSPFMPWQQLAKMTDGDVRAIYLYLRQVRPIRNDVRPQP